jgi:hypothetical protein
LEELEATHDSAPETVQGGSTADIQVRYVLVNNKLGWGLNVLQKQLCDSLCENSMKFLRREIFVVVNTKVLVSWDVATPWRNLLPALSRPNSLLLP